VFCVPITHSPKYHWTQSRMADSDPTHLDPRIRRTRNLLEQALFKLLETKSFEEISIQDITEAATLNRGTFYAHYTDKYALLECVTAGRFFRLLEERDVIFDGTCASGLGKTFLGICDYLVEATSDCQGRGRPVDPRMELAIVSVVKKLTLDGLKQQQPWTGLLSQEMVAAIISSALYGAAKEWFETPVRPRAEDTVDEIVALIGPLMHGSPGN